MTGGDFLQAILCISWRISLFLHRTLFFMALFQWRIVKKVKQVQKIP